MVCSICGSKNVNKSSCPLYIKNPKPENWDKHPRAREIVRKGKKVKIPVRKKIFKNPFIEKKDKICNVSKRVIGQIDTRLKIILTGHILKHYDINIRNPSNLKIEIMNNRNNRDKIIEFLSLYCDIYRRLALLKPNRVDFFTNPDSGTLKILRLRIGIKTEFIKFIINNENRHGGIPDNIDLNTPIDDILRVVRMSINLPDISNLLLPEVPSHDIGLKSKSQRRNAIAIRNDR